MECRGLAAHRVSDEYKTITGRKSGGAVKFDEASFGCPYRLEPKSLRSYCLPRGGAKEGGKRGGAL